MVRLDAGVDHHGALAAPMLVAREGPNAMNIRRRIGARKRYPQEIVEAPGREFAFINEHDQRKGIDRVNRLESRAEGRGRPLALDSQHTGQTYPRLSKALGERHCTRRSGEAMSAVAALRRQR